ncbi:acyl-CoA dehydrogenase [Nocardioides sp.]|uniref:acyl-CoA dehydrogenase n=1 Tax=Nocardioides sp. TaxID=35761 RepID=UPI002D80F361|nr:acyl-CoA dehydrogenase [Nocardioides sp.]HET8960337.1 acyl-CoA dehydrogenase [Nocardioides sp.]
MLGISEEHAELAASLRKWAATVGGPDAARAEEGDPAATFDDAWGAVGEMGVATIALAESAGGGGGTVLDLAVALEACAHGLVPGPLLATAIASVVLPPSTELPGARVGLALEPWLIVGERLAGTVEVVWDAPGATHLLLGGREPGGAEAWFVVPAARVECSTPTQRSSSGTRPAGLDLTRRFGSVTVDLATDELEPVPALDAARLRRAAVTLAAAEASGIARWCLETAVEYAGVREQFGARIGSFQAIKHLCAEMLETAEAVTAAAWDAASVAGGDDDQWAFAADVAGAVALDGAVRNAQACIQVLGGIGFTFEHDAHLYLRRAVSLRSLLGSPDAWAASLAQRAVAGQRRRTEVDLGGRDVAVRDDVRRRVAEIAAAPVDRQRTALVESGYLTPHWPEPHGLAADAVTQLVIDEELAAAGVERPDLKIGGWAAPTVLAHGSADQRERFVRPTLLGELTWCQLFSEPGAGSDLASLRTRAVRATGPAGEEGWRLTGQKVWTSLAHDADWAICLARTDPDVPQHRGITYFLLDMRADGVDIRPLREMTGDAMFNEVFLDDVFVGDDCVVGEPGDGWRLARTTLANERVAMAGSRLGVSTERAVSLAPSASPAEQVRVGHAVALATVCSLLGTRSTLRSLAGQGPGAESSVAKLLGVRSRQDASELVVDLHGARVVLGGEEVEQDVHEMLLTRCLSIAGGTTQILRNVAAERILGLPR